MKRHEVGEEEWALLDPLIPKPVAKTGRPPGTSARCSTASFGSPRPVPNGGICPNGSGRGKRCTVTSTRGGPAGCSIRSSRPCICGWIGKVRSTGSCGASMARRSGALGPPPARQKKHPEASRRTGRSRFGPLAGRFRVQIPPPRRWQRYAARSRRDGGAGVPGQIVVAFVAELRL